MAGPLLLQMERDPEHLRQTTQQWRGWNSGGGTSLRLTSFASPSDLLSVMPHPHPAPVVSGVSGFVCFVFKNLQFDYSSFIQGKTSRVVFLWKYIYYICYYYYFLQISPSTASSAGQEREKLTEGIRFLFFPPHGSGLSCQSQDEMRKGRKKKKRKKEFSPHSPPALLLYSSPPFFFLLLCLLYSTSHTFHQS